jgi:hypothetical protein
MLTNPEEEDSAEEMEDLEEEDSNSPFVYKKGLEQSRSFL